jgi:hypothetical protein
MTALTPKARALVQAGKTALRATSADRERIEAALRVRLGSDALPLDNGVTAAGSGASWQAVAGVATGVCVLGALAVLALRPAASAPVPPARSAAPPPAQSALPDLPPTAAGAPAPFAVPPELGSSPEQPGTSAPRPRDRLAREVALLSRATSQLRAGHAAAALRTLGEHQRNFPNGALSEERRAAEAQALCLLGRVGEGRAKLAQLAPGSPAAARAAELCAEGASDAADRK